MLQYGGIGLLLAVWSGSADGVGAFAWTTGSGAEVTSALGGGAVQVAPLSRSTRAPSNQEWMRDLLKFESREKYSLATFERKGR